MTNKEKKCLFTIVLLFFSVVTMSSVQANSCSIAHDVLVERIEKKSLGVDDYSFCFFNAADLSKAHMSGPKMYHADLGNANLADAFLSGDYREAHLALANLEGATMQNVDMEKAWLVGANLKNVKMSGVNLKDANLQDADFTGADMHNVDLTGAQTHGAKFPDDLKGVTGLELK